ncbi:AraC family transcriptional regulator [Amorphus coralli]|uniref:AraC family transcriptional regulator n=1 Tax=Amorphus coralli TaxID=340680 RepID=UPI000684AC19|nr:AraC family transcriptional regulator [Amorphus coralli]
MTQPQALAATPPSARERVEFWRAPRFDALECLSATFRTHAYAPHSHETFVIGIIETGCETFRVRGVRHYAVAGDICFVNPDEVHDGEPEGDGYSYRMTYPSIGLIREIAEDLGGAPLSGTPGFTETCVRDRDLARRFAIAHRRLGNHPDSLAQDEGLVSVYADAVARYARVAPRRVGREPPAIRRTIDYLDAHYGDDIGLDELTRLAGLSRTALIRAFRRETGLTPHAWLTDRRVRAARARLAGGAAPSDVAMACGFYDQSHLNRAFKARIGVTPGAFRRQ